MNFGVKCIQTWVFTSQTVPSRGSDQSSRASDLQSHFGVQYSTYLDATVLHLPRCSPYL